jgi:hypothetical protein
VVVVRLTLTALIVLFLAQDFQLSLALVAEKAQLLVELVEMVEVVVGQVVQVFLLQELVQQIKVLMVRTEAAAVVVVVAVLLKQVELMRPVMVAMDFHLVLRALLCFVVVAVVHLIPMVQERVQTLAVEARAAVVVARLQHSLEILV